METTENSDEILCGKSLNFLAVLKAAVEDTLKSVSYERFIYLYKEVFIDFEKKENVTNTALKGTSKEARSYQNAFNEVVLKSALEDIDCFMKQSQMNEKFQLLESLLLDNDKKSDMKKVWRPPGDARKHMDSFDYALKLKNKQELENMLEEDMKEIEDLKSDLIKKRKRITNLHKNVLNVSKKLKCIVT